MTIKMQDQVMALPCSLETATKVLMLLMAENNPFKAGDE